MKYDRICQCVFVLLLVASLACSPSVSQEKLKDFDTSTSPTHIDGQFVTKR